MYSRTCGPGMLETPTLATGRRLPKINWLADSALKPHEFSAPGDEALNSESARAPMAFCMRLAWSVRWRMRRSRSTESAIPAPSATVRNAMSLPPVDSSPARRSTAHRLSRRWGFRPWRPGSVASRRRRWRRIPLAPASTPSAYPQVLSRRFACFHVVRFGISAGQRDFCRVFDSRQLHGESPGQDVKVLARFLFHQHLIRRRLTALTGRRNCCRRSSRRPCAAAVVLGICNA
jgi:hypothetical protein